MQLVDRVIRKSILIHDFINQEVPKLFGSPKHWSTLGWKDPRYYGRGIHGRSYQFSLERKLYMYTYFTDAALRAGFVTTSPTQLCSLES